MARALITRARHLSPETLEAGARWYPDVWGYCRYLAEPHGQRPRAIAGALAALSPRMRLSANMAAVLRVLAGQRAGTFAHCEAKADAILSGFDPLVVLRGPKTTAFYRAIIGDRQSVTVDTWAARAAGWPLASLTLTPKRYAAIARAYRYAALDVDAYPRDLQAAVWIDVRGRAD